LKEFSVLTYGSFTTIVQAESEDEARRLASKDCKYDWSTWRELGPRAVQELNVNYGLYEGLQGTIKIPVARWKWMRNEFARRFKEREGKAPEFVEAFSDFDELWQYNVGIIFDDTNNTITLQVRFGERAMQVASCATILPLVIGLLEEVGEWPENTGGKLWHWDAAGRFPPFPTDTYRAYGPYGSPEAHTKE